MCPKANANAFMYTYVLLGLFVLVKVCRCILLAHVYMCHHRRYRCTRIMPSNQKKENHEGNENHSPHQWRRSHFGTGYCKTPPPQRKRKKSIEIKHMCSLLDQTN